MQRRIHTELLSDQPGALSAWLLSQPLRECVAVEAHEQLQQAAGSQVLVEPPALDGERSAAFPPLQGAKQEVPNTERAISGRALGGLARDATPAVSIPALSGLRPKKQLFVPCPARPPSPLPLGCRWLLLSSHCSRDRSRLRVPSRVAARSTPGLIALTLVFTSKKQGKTRAHGGRRRRQPCPAARVTRKRGNPRSRMVRQPAARIRKVRALPVRELEQPGPPQPPPPPLPPSFILGSTRQSAR